MKTRLLMVMMMVLCLTAFSSRATAKMFNNNDFKGTYAFEAQGTFFQDVDPTLPQNGTENQIGVYKPDGQGKLCLSPCRIIINGNPAALFQGFLEGTYTVDPDGIVDMSTTLFDSNMQIVTTSGCQGVIGQDSKSFFFFTIPVPLPGFTILQDQHGSAVKQ